ncbi:hypothetical protein [Blastococcus sp. TF02A-35]|uniref:hypothetical protein n=1 Tax=Blastococcus sp. TF02A-35 TaxID=2559612 RepID=UPI0010739573|nr:hypothetical protein [Blastococcus sp. TF02A_35]TFV53313.1 hypothetical protein E4P43_01890 [Blastococcus sp. TF02A_35]
MAAPAEDYVEPGGSWRPLWVVGGAALLFLALELVLPGPDLPVVAWAALAVVLGIVAGSCLAARRLWTVRVEGAGDDGALSVGRERLALTEVDGEHLAGVDSGVDAGAPVLGGGWSLPQGRTGLPLRLADGRTVLVPTRDPGALRTALLTAKGTLGP